MLAETYARGVLPQPAVVRPELRAASGSARLPPKRTHLGRLAGRAVEADRASGCASSGRTASRSFTLMSRPLEAVFERAVEACIPSDLVGGEGFAVDASLIAADANKQRSIAGQDWRKDRNPKSASRALATLDDTAWGAASVGVPKFVSPSDPAAQRTGAHKGPAFFSFGVLACPQ